MSSFSNLRTGFLLSLSLCCAIASIAFVFTISAKQRTAAADKQLRMQLAALLPEQFNNVPTKDVIQLSDSALGSSEPQKVYRARYEGEPTGAVITTHAPDGYNGDITLLVGFTYSGTIRAVRVLSHRETPGLGDDIEALRSDWVHDFANLDPQSMTQPDWNVKKFGGQFDQFTGATITPQAVVRAVMRTALWYKESRNLIFAKEGSQ